jgi:hypothetical protein
MKLYDFMPFFRLCFSHKVKFAISYHEVLEMAGPHTPAINFTSKASPYEVLNALGSTHDHNYTNIRIRRMAQRLITWIAYNLDILISVNLDLAMRPRCIACSRVSSNSTNSRLTPVCFTLPSISVFSFLISSRLAKECRDKAPMHFLQIRSKYFLNKIRQKWHHIYLASKNKLKRYCILYLYSSAPLFACIRLSWVQGRKVRTNLRRSLARSAILSSRRI